MVGVGFDGEENLFVEEAGASYFVVPAAREVRRRRQAQNHDTRRVDGQNLLLTASYDGWFWAFLEEHVGIGPLELSQMHQAVKSGTDVVDALNALVPNMPKRLNEFFVKDDGAGT